MFSTPTATALAMQPRYAYGVLGVMFAVAALRNLADALAAALRRTGMWVAFCAFALLLCAALLKVFWGRVEAMLARRLARELSYMLGGTGCVVKAVSLRRNEIVAHGVELPNGARAADGEAWKAPFFLRADSIVVTTEDLQGTLSLFGAWRSRRDRSFVVGYTERAANTLDVRGLRVYVENRTDSGGEGSTGNYDYLRENSRRYAQRDRETAAATADRESEWHERWYSTVERPEVELELDESSEGADGDTKKRPRELYPSLASARIASARKAYASARRLSKSPAHRAALIRQWAERLRTDFTKTVRTRYQVASDVKTHDRLRVGRVTVGDLALDMDGVAMTLSEPFVLTAFVGSRAALENTLCASLLAELLSESVASAQEWSEDTREQLKAVVRGKIRERERAYYSQANARLQQARKAVSSPPSPLALFARCVGGPSDSVDELIDDDDDVTAGGGADDGADAVDDNDDGGVTTLRANDIADDCPFS